MTEVTPEAIARRKDYSKRWQQENRVHLREYMRAYRRKNHEALELKRKCRLAGVKP